MEFPQRKQNRLCNYDYSLNGAYFVTICTQDRKKILSQIVGDDAHIVLMDALQKNTSATSPKSKNM